MASEGNRYNLDVVFGLNPENFTEGVLKIQKKLGELNSSFEENKRKISDTTKEITTYRAQQKALAMTIENSGQATKEQKAKMKELTDKITQATANLGQLKAAETTIKTEIKTTTTELQKQMGAIDKNANSVSLLDKALSKISATVKAFIGIYGAKKLWELLIGSNAEMEQYQTSFEVMLGDAEKAKKMIEDLRVFAAKTPLAMNDVISTGTLLMNYGVADNNLISTMTKLGDLASGNAEKLNRVALAYGQMLAKGKVSGEELRQMTEAGVPLQDALAKFQLTRPVWGVTPDDRLVYYALSFQLTRPVWGVTPDDRLVYYALSFQLTRPVWGVTPT